MRCRFYRINLHLVVDHLDPPDQTADAALLYGALLRGEAIGVCIDFHRFPVAAVRTFHPFLLSLRPGLKTRRQFVDERDKFLQFTGEQIPHMGNAEGLPFKFSVAVVEGIASLAESTL